jgi:acetoacetyl-CoA synthetase
LFAADGYQFNGRIYDRREETARLREKLPSLTGTVLIPTLFGVAEPTDGVPSWDELAGGDANLEFEQVPFDHPLWVLFSSGTTGKPKGIVHGHGGALLEHLVVNGLHFDLGPSDTFFWYTTTNWMMWNVLASGLLTGSTVVTYDGNPTYPDPGFLWRLVEQHQVTVFGTSPGHLEVSAKAGLEPGRDLDLSHLRILGSTGATLPASAYRWVRDHVGTQIQVASISGGTDVVGLFAGSAPTTPVYAGELSARCLGVPAQSWGPTGNSQVGEVGELVITGPMPSMPLGFWNDTDGTRYRDSYFNVYPGVWRHGDWVTITTHGSVIFHGRSDSTLNRNGVRLGSAEIYEAVSGVPQIADSLILGIDEPDGGYWMPLFVVLTPRSNPGPGPAGRDQEGDQGTRLTTARARRDHPGHRAAQNPHRQETRSSDQTPLPGRRPRPGRRPQLGRRTRSPERTRKAGHRPPRPTHRTTQQRAPLTDPYQHTKRRLRHGPNAAPEVHFTIGWSNAALQQRHRQLLGEKTCRHQPIPARSSWPVPAPLSGNTGGPCPP